MIRIILGFVFIFSLIYMGYKYITNLGVDELESLMEKIPIIVSMITVTIIIVTFIVVNF